MTYVKTFLLLAALATVTACAGNKLKAAHSSNPLKNSTVQSINSLDVPRYMGKWYEIGRLPMFFQRKCAKNTTASYEIKEDGSINVTNRCQTNAGKQIAAIGRATQTKQPGQLKVTFAPSWIRWLPMTQADYWILKLDDDYQYALVGTPDNKYLWLLSRTAAMPEAVYDDYIAHAKSQGFDLNKWIKTEHN